jgi:hypothetical protein
MRNGMKFLFHSFALRLTNTVGPTKGRAENLGNQILYSQTCVKQPPLGPEKCVLLAKVPNKSEF